MKKYVFLILVLLSSLLVSGCVIDQDDDNNGDNDDDETNINIDDDNNDDTNINNENRNDYSSKVDIFIIDSGFMPKEIKVKAGSQVTWTNDADEPHVIETTDGFFTSDELQNGDSVTFTFEKPGKYEYFSTEKPEIKGIIIVE